jgi:putative salt-induced outer membrane protein YdiY
MRLKARTQHPFLLVYLLLFSAFASAQTPTPPPQEPPPPPPVYTGSFGGGLALTSGNSDTKNYNLAFSLVRDPKKKNVIKFNALYLRGTQMDVLSIDRAAVTLRDEYTISNRVFTFQQLDYLHDQFKQIRYLITPIGGMGYKLITNDHTSLAFSGGAGGVWEKDIGFAVKGSGDINLGESFGQKISSTAAITESVSTLWKTNDFEDSLTNFAAGVTTSINRKLELKVEFQDNYKNKPVLATLKKNDTAFLTTFVVKY